MRKTANVDPKSDTNIVGYTLRRICVTSRLPVRQVVMIIVKIHMPDHVISVANQRLRMINL